MSSHPAAFTTFLFAPTAFSWEWICIHTRFDQIFGQPCAIFDSGTGPWSSRVAAEGSVIGVLGAGFRVEGFHGFRSHAAAFPALPFVPLRVIDAGLVGSTALRRVPREQKMLKGHLPRVIYHQVYKFTKIISWS